MVRRVLIAAVGAALAVTLAIPAAAGPPDRFEVPFTPNFPDFEQEFVVFVNIDRASYCTPEVVEWENAVIAWLEGGMVGPPPPEPEFPEGFDPISVQEKVTGQGAVVGHADGSDLTIELWNFDSEENLPLVGPCTDTDDDGSFFASGTTSFKGNDNDLHFTGTRANAFGDQGNADVTDGDGNDYEYSWKFHLNSSCYVPEDGPPACLIERSKLQARG